MLLKATSASSIHPRTAHRTSGVQSASHSRRVLVVRSAVADYSQRVKGDVRRVFHYISDVKTWPEWMPGVSEATQTMGSGQTVVKARYFVQRNIANWRAMTTYELVDLQLNRKVVYQASSEMHTASEQLVLMPDPLDANYTVVRFISNTQLREWRAALTPILGGVLSKVPEEALKRLAKVLASPNTPLRNIKLPREEPARNHAHRSSDASAGAKQPWSFASIFGGSRSTADLFDRTSAAEASSFFSAASASSTSTSSGRAAAFTTSASTPSASMRTSVVAMPADALGFYETLGLTAATSTSAEDVKAAFRRAAQQYHPDKFLSPSMPERERQRAHQRYSKVQRAYEVLRDDEQRRQYDAGQLREEWTL